jgi:hypothetical protein
VSPVFAALVSGCRMRLLRLVAGITSGLRLAGGQSLWAQGREAMLKESLLSSGLVDQQYYLEHNPDVAADVTKEVRSNGFWIKAPGK